MPKPYLLVKKNVLRSKYKKFKR